MNLKRFASLWTVVLVASFAATRTSRACLSYELNTTNVGNRTVLQKTLQSVKTSEIALRNSGRPLTISLAFFAFYGLIGGADITPLLYHGAWLANAQNIPALDVNYTFCATGEVKTKASVTKASCPCDLDEKFFTHFSRNFGVFSCRFGFAGAKDIENLDTVEPSYVEGMLMDTTIGYVAVVLILLLLRLPFLFMTRKHYEDDIDAAGNYKYCGKCPQNKLPMYPVRYWLEVPNVTLKLTIGIHMGLTFTSFSGIALYNTTGDSKILLFALPLLLFVLLLPIFACYKTRKLINAGANGELGGVVYVEATRYEGWRDTDVRDAKTWRMSKQVNRWGGLFFNLKEKRWYWNAYRMIFNLVEGAIIIGLPLSNDLRGMIIVIVYFMQWIFLLVQRPYRYWGMFLIEFIQMFHNVFLYMSSTLYITDGIFNAQSLISAETDGVEEMMMVLGSGMTCLHIVRVFYVSTNNLNAGFWQSQHGDARSWDVECDDKRSQPTGNRKDKVERSRLNQARSSVDESWTMKRIDHKNAKETTTPFKGDDSATGVAMVNPMVKTSQKNNRSADAPKEPKRKSTALPADWASATDPNSGKVYYYNKQTHETRWTKPKST